MDSCSRSTESSTWGLAQISSGSSDGRTDPEVDLYDDSVEATLSASMTQSASSPAATGTREELYSQLQGLQQELYHNQELQQALRMAEQQQSQCGGCGYSQANFQQAPFATPWKPPPVGVQQHQLQQRMEMMQMQRQLEQLQCAISGNLQAPWHPSGHQVGPLSSTPPNFPAQSREEANALKKKTIVQPQTPDKPFYNENGVDLMKLSDFELEKVVPLNERGERTSIGALQHPDKCSRCIFWFRNICEKGIRCEFCHFTHPGQIAKKIRPSKSVRLKQKEQEKKSEAV